MPPFRFALFASNKTEIRLPGENMMNARYQYLAIGIGGMFWKISDGLFRRFVKGGRALSLKKPWSIPAHDRNT